jgi:hypothetical protein
LKSTATIPASVLQGCLSAISDTDAIIVGGQALAYWGDFFDVDVFVSENGVTRDLDIFGSREHLFQMAGALQVKAQVQNPKFISALVGTIEIDVGDQVSNIDVIHKIYGLDNAAVIKHAISVEIAGYNCKVMHPVDVLESRLRNLEGLRQKQNEQGINQCRMAISIVSKYIAKLIEEDDEKSALKIVEHIVSLGKSACGKTASHNGLKLLSAIPFNVFKNSNFHKIRKPQILEELSHL